MTTKELIEQYIRTACRFYTAKNPLVPAILYGSAAAFALGLKADRPRDVDIMASVPVANSYSRGYVDQTVPNAEVYALLAANASEYEGAVRLPSVVDYISTGWLHSTNRDTQLQAYTRRLTPAQLQTVLALLQANAENERSADAQAFVLSLLEASP